MNQDLRQAFGDLMSAAEAENDELRKEVARLQAELAAQRAYNESLLTRLQTTAVTIMPLVVAEVQKQEAAIKKSKYGASICKTCGNEYQKTGPSQRLCATCRHDKMAETAVRNAPWQRPKAVGE